MCSKLKRTNAGGEKCVWDGFEFCHEFLDDFFKICRQCDSTAKNNVSRSAVGRMSARKNQVLRIKSLFDGSEFFCLECGADACGGDEEVGETLHTSRKKVLGQIGVL
jgi:hypothetical protein